MRVQEQNAHRCHLARAAAAVQGAVEPPSRVVGHKHSSAPMGCSKQSCRELPSCLGRPGRPRERSCTPGTGCCTPSRGFMSLTRLQSHGGGSAKTGNWRALGLRAGHRVSAAHLQAGTVPPSWRLRPPQPGRASPEWKGLALLGVGFRWTLGVVVLQVDNLGGLFGGPRCSGTLEVPGQSQAGCWALLSGVL